MSFQLDPENIDPIEGTAGRRHGLTVTSLASVFIGGALGTVARYLLVTGYATGAGHFPWPTVLINLSGSLLVGFLIPVTERVGSRVSHVRPLLVVGVLGGWTTYSTLAVDAVQLGQHGHVLSMLGYLAATVAGGLAAVLVGNTVGHRVAVP
jgi:CrcB protein